MTATRLGVVLATFVPVVVLANLAILLVPHARGIAWAPSLRYAVTTPLIALVVTAAAFAYGSLGQVPDAPRMALAGALAVVALLALVAMGTFGAPGVVRAGAPAVLVVAFATAVFIPYFTLRPPGVIALALLSLGGAVEVAGAYAAFASEVDASPPRADGLAFDVPRALFDVDHKLIKLPSGVRVHYIDEGSGPTLLFLHGNPAWSFQWRDLITGLRGHYRCVALDYPGFGLSSAPAGYGYTAREQSQVVEELVEALRLRDVTLVMQDWGGPIGLGFAGRRPDLVTRVVLGNTWAWPTSTSEARGKFSMIAGGPIGEFAQMNFNAFARFGLAHGVMHELPADVTALYLRPFRPLSGRGVAAFYPGEITAASDYLSEVSAGLERLRDKKALIFWGMRDQGSPRPDLARFEASFPTHETIEFADADHFFFEDKAAVMIREMSRFLFATAEATAAQ